MATTQAGGKYEVIEKIGSGGMATVYRAWQPMMGRDVALKVLRLTGDPDQDVVDRFLREARTVGGLSDANIVTVFEYFEHEGAPCIAMEYLERGSLRPYLGKMSPAQRFGALRGVLSGLVHAAERQVVHRDLKPENLLVTRGGTVKIADFGIARARDRVDGEAYTATGVAIGTPRYMAPEQGMGREVGAYTDLYSLGVIAYEMFVGKLPFTGGGTPMAVMSQHLSEPVPPPMLVNPDVDPEVSAWIERLLIKDPADRTRDPREARDELDEIAGGLLGAFWERSAPLPALLPTPGRGASRPPEPGTDESQVRVEPEAASGGMNGMSAPAIEPSGVDSGAGKASESGFETWYDRDEVAHDEPDVATGRGDGDRVDAWSREAAPDPAPPVDESIDVPVVQPGPEPESVVEPVVEPESVVEPEPIERGVAEREPVSEVVDRTLAERGGVGAPEIVGPEPFEVPELADELTVAPRKVVPPPPRDRARTPRVEREAPTPEVERETPAPDEGRGTRESDADRARRGARAAGRRRLVVAGGALVATVAAVVVGYSVGHGPVKPSETAGRVPVRAEQRDALAFKTPASWQPAEAPTSGKVGESATIDAALAAGPGGNAASGVMAAALSGKFGDGLLPTGVKVPSGVAATPVRLSEGVEALRYSGLDLGALGKGTVFAVATGTGVSTLVCAAAVPGDACGAMATTLRLPGQKAQPLGPDATLAAGISRTLGTLSIAARGPREQLATARTRAGQASAARRLASPYAAAATSLRALPVTTRSEAAVGRLASSTEQTGLALRRLARAAAAGNRSGYRAARSTLLEQQRATAAAAQRLKALGYAVRTAR